MSRCETCAHWQKCDEWETGYAQGLGRCGAAPMFWNMTEWKEVDDDYRREFKPEAENTTAFVQDGSDYVAKLFTRPTHGCTMHAPRKDSPASTKSDVK
jgi:hypothetical protein